MDVAALATLSALANLWTSPVLTELDHGAGRATQAVPTWRRWRRRKPAATNVVQG
jgi:hypothetical protein